MGASGDERRLPGFELVGAGFGEPLWLSGVLRELDGLVPPPGWEDALRRLPRGASQAEPRLLERLR